MKKIFAILVSLILAISSFMVYATEETQQDEVQTYKEIFAQYLEELGYNLGNDLFVVGKFGDNTLVRVYTNGPTMDVQHHKIGSYDVESMEGYYPYRLGLYVIKNTKVYTLEEAYEKGIINDDTLDKMVELMQNNSDNRFLYLRFTKRNEETTKPTTTATEPPTPATTDPTNPEPPTPATTDPTNPEPITPAPQAEISAKKFSLKAGKTMTLNVSNGTAKSWSSSDKKIATVKNGKITALKKGNAIITATLKNGEKLAAKVKVTSNPKLNKTTKKLKVKDKFTLKVNGKAGTAKFKSNNPKIATVTKKGVVKAKKTGTAKITVTTNGGVKLKCTVKVK